MHRWLIAGIAVLALLVAACASAGVDGSVTPTSTRTPVVGGSLPSAPPQGPSPTSTSQPLPPFWPDMPLTSMPGWMQPMLLERLNFERLRLLEAAPRLLEVDLYSEAPRWNVEFGADGDRILYVTGNLDSPGPCNGAEFFPDPCRNWYLVKKGAKVTITGGDSRSGWWSSLDRTEGSAACTTHEPYSSDTVRICSFTMDSDYKISMYWYGSEFPGLTHFVYPTCPTQRKATDRPFAARC